MTDADSDPQARLRHDLRTPLHQIIGYAELLEEEARDRGDEGHLEDLARIRAAARQALEVIDLAVPSSRGSGASGPIVAPSVSDATGSRECHPAGSALHAAAVRVLVVDDNEPNRNMLARRLGSRGFQVETVESGALALDKLAAGRFDLVLLDVMMPGMSGLKVLRQVRSRWPESDLPVIMVTARDATEDVVEALRAGANDYLMKPLDFPVVLARVEMQLTLGRQKQEIRRLAEDLELRNRFIRGLFGRYVSEEVVSDLLASPDGPTIGGEQRKVTLLLSDVRGFTPLTEGLSPEHVLRLLNSYLGAMADVILAHQGTIDEIVGDGILAIFGAPLSRPDDARRAVACSVAMQSALAELNERNRARGLPRLEMGVCVHTGNVIVGNIGSERRTKYGVVGSTVNHAGRIESFTVGGQVLVSEATLAEAGEDVRVGERLAIEGKGMREPVVVYDLQGIGEGSLPDADEKATSLNEPIRAACQVVEGKRVEAETFGAEVIELSPHGATLLSPRSLSPLLNLKLELRPAKHDPVQLYAKVVSVGSDGSANVRFTSRPAEVERWLRAVVAEARGLG